jgi:exonuclease VII large subunit
VLDDHGGQLDETGAEVVRRSGNALDRAARKLDQCDRQARALDPHRLLARGWSITRTADGTIARAADLALGAELATTFADGSARSAVTAVAVGATDGEQEAGA